MVTSARYNQLSELQQKFVLNSHAQFFKLLNVEPLRKCFVAANPLITLEWKGTALAGCKVEGKEEVKTLAALILKNINEII